MGGFKQFSGITKTHFIKNCLGGVAIYSFFGRRRYPSAALHFLAVLLMGGAIYLKVRCSFAFMFMNVLRVGAQSIAHLSQKELQARNIFCGKSSQKITHGLCCWQLRSEERRVGKE